MADTKDTIYIDVDDEITAIVDKVQASGSKIVALVLPKRATVLQSVVNMKLLKRASDEAGKKTVLITSEVGLLPLAGAAGLYTAKNLQSKPEIPASPDLPTDQDEELVESLADESADDASVDKLAGAAAIGAVATSKPDEATPASASDKKPSKQKSKKSGSPAIPNFNKFRKKLFIIGGAIALLILFWVLAVFVLPKATIAVETNTETIPSNFEFTADTEAEKVDIDDTTVPAKFATEKVQESAKATASGTKDVGAKAKGSVTIRNCSDGGVSIKSGTGVSSSGQTFITQSGLALESGNFDSGGDCKASGTHVSTVSVVAQKNGDQYNLSSGASYNVSGFSSTVSGTGSAMTGGSSKTVKIVAQADIDKAKENIDIDEDKIKADLIKGLKDDDFYVIESSFTKQSERTSSSVKAGQEANEVTVSYEAEFLVVAVKRDELGELIKENIKDQIDEQRQELQNDGLDDAEIEVVENDQTDTSVNIILDTQAEVGPNIDVEQLKTDIAGKKSGDTESIVKSLPGVQNVEVKYSPFWVNKTPGSLEKINIEFKSAEPEE